MAPNEKYNIL